MGIPSSKVVYVEPYYLVGIKMDLVKYIFEKPALMGRIARW